MNANNRRVRAEALSGQGYGTLRGRLLVNARRHIENAIRQQFYCEAIAVIESVITDRLESRLSHLKGENFGFLTLGFAIKNLKDVEIDTSMNQILTDLDNWREKRNRALHELVKIELGQSLIDWDSRIAALSIDAQDGYELLKRLYHRVADLNPLHIDRVFPYPQSLPIAE